MLLSLRGKWALIHRKRSPFPQGKANSYLLLRKLRVSLSRSRPQAVALTVLGLRLEPVRVRLQKKSFGLFSQDDSLNARRSLSPIAEGIKLKPLGGAAAVREVSSLENPILFS